MRHASHSPSAEKTAVKIASNMDKVTAGMRAGLNITYAMRVAMGKKLKSQNLTASTLNKKINAKRDIQKITNPFVRLFSRKKKKNEEEK